MSPIEKADLILHPVRLQILQTLAGRKLTTAQIAAELPDIPVSSIYRHLKRLLDGGMVQVADSTPVRGVEEKTYILAQAAQINAQDLAQMNQAEHVHAFVNYLATLLEGFSSYIRSADQHDFAAERTGYTEVQFFASIEEMDQFGILLNEGIKDLLGQPPAPDRVRRKFSVISHPLKSQPGQNENPSITEPVENPG